VLDSPFRGSEAVARGPVTPRGHRGRRAAGPGAPAPRGHLRTSGCSRGRSSSRPGPPCASVAPSRPDLARFDQQRS